MTIKVPPSFVVNVLPDKLAELGVLQLSKIVKLCDQTYEREEHFAEILEATKKRAEAARERWGAASAEYTNKYRTTEYTHRLPRKTRAAIAHQNARLLRAVKSAKSSHDRETLKLEKVKALIEKLK